MKRTIIIDGMTCRRIQFRHVKVGMDLCWRHRPIGRVVDTERDAGGVSAVTLDDGQRLTRRGWMSRRLWRVVQ